MTGLRQGAVVLAFALLPGGAMAAQGWYMLAPPIEPSGQRLVVQRHAPISRWSQSGVYDTAAACGADRIIMGKMMGKMLMQGATDAADHKTERKLQ
jgi:hypothetical protein